MGFSSGNLIILLSLLKRWLRNELGVFGVVLFVDEILVNVSIFGHIFKIQYFIEILQEF